MSKIPNRARLIIIYKATRAAQHEVPLSWISMSRSLIYPLRRESLIEAKFGEITIHRVDSLLDLLFYP